MTDGEAVYAVLGSEIRARVHYAMPVKDMLYDSLHYAKQVEEAKRSYHNRGRKKKRARLSSEEFYKFNTDFGKVLQYIKYSKDKEKLYKVTHEEKRFRNVDEDSANLINVVTGSGLKFEVKRGQVDMCTAIDEMRKESRSEGFLEALAGLVRKGLLSVGDAAKEAGLSPVEFQARTGIRDGSR